MQAIYVKFGHNRGPYGEDHAYWRAFQRRNNLEAIVAQGYISNKGRARFAVAPVYWLAQSKQDLLWSIEQEYKSKHHRLRKVLRKKAIDRVRA